ncbi:MAG: ABC transporter transmembrane domain-containing protein, partial [Haliea sp.]|uniref:ABC transporter transmembrane domain-containing protein n=1 Tax=Haliea sp. TaxID=1932666 RepID=UPI0032EC1183
MAPPPGRSLSPLLAIFRFLLPYRARLLGAGGALLFTAGATLFLGRGIQVLIDEGFGGGTSADLRNAISVIMVIAGAMAIGTFLRFYLVSWLGERVSADLRKAVFDNIIRLDPGYFETNRSGEIMSRLTTDTTLLQT